MKSFLRFSFGKTQNKLILSSAVILMVMILAVTIVVFSAAASALSRQTRSAIARQTEYARRNLNTALADYENLLLSMRLNRSLHKLLNTTQFPDYIDFSEHIADITDYLHIAISGCAYVPRVTLYVCGTYDYKLPVNDMIAGAGEVETEAWYREAVAAPRSQIIWRVYSANAADGSALPMLSAVINIRDRDTGALLAVARVEQQMTWIAKAFENTLDLSHGDVYILDSGNCLLFGIKNGLPGGVLPKGLSDALSGLAPAQSLDTLIDGLPQTLFVELDKKRDWKIVYVTGTSLLAEQKLILERSLFLLLVPVIIGALLLVILASNMVTRRLVRLTAAVEAVDDQNLTLNFPDGGNDEVTTLHKAFARLLRTAQELIDKNRRTEREKYAIELQALQEQVTPHFLYNTLSSINAMAQEIEAEDISRAILTLADFYRLSLSHGANRITVAEELELLEYYLDICCIRFGEKLHIALDFAADVLDCLTPKLVMQPFVENAIMHGLRTENAARCDIAICAAGDDKKVYIRITDNGTGIAAEQLAAMQTAAYNPDKHHAIQNIHHRIQLACGEGYGVTMESKPGKGTTALITLPRLYPASEPIVTDPLPYSDG